MSDPIRTIPAALPLLAQTRDRDPNVGVYVLNLYQIAQRQQQGYVVMPFNNFPGGNPSPGGPPNPFGGPIPVDVAVVPIGYMQVRVSLPPAQPLPAPRTPVMLDP